MNECCRRIPIQNKETETTQWNKDGSSEVVEYYTEYKCEKCGRNVIMKFDLK